MIFIAICDVKSGRDEAAYSQLEKLRSDRGVTPLVIGRLFEEADVLLILHSVDIECLDDYLIKRVRSIPDVQELVVVPIYEFKLLSSFDFMIDSEHKVAVPFSSEPEELLFFITKIDVAPTKDRAVYKHILSIESTDDTLPLMTGHTFHSKEFDIALFFLAKSLESAWGFVKSLRTADGVLDTEVSLIAHFEGLTPLKRFRELTAKTSASSSRVHTTGGRKTAR